MAKWLMPLVALVALTRFSAAAPVVQYGFEYPPARPPAQPQPPVYMLPFYGQGSPTYITPFYP